MIATSRATTSALGIRGLRTSVWQSALGPRGSPSSSASQPVFKRDAPPPPSPPLRPSTSTRFSSPSPVSTPTSPTTEPTKRGGKQGSVYASYKALPYNTKLIFWTCGAMLAAVGLLAADKLEELFPARNNKAIRPGSSTSTPAGPKFIDHNEPTNEAKTQERKPKLFSISVVDRS